MHSSWYAFDQSAREHGTQPGAAVHELFSFMLGA